VESGDLFDYIVLNGRLTEDESRHFFQQIIAGVDYCHTNRVVHRDLKPENLLLDQERSSIKIADFGLSNIMRDGQFLKSSCGSPNYAAPEVIQRHWYAGPEVDVWSCGVILYAMLCGVLPFDDENISSLYRKIIDCCYMLPSHLSVEARDLITSMLKADPMHRISIAEIRRHPFFQLQLPRYIALPPAETAYQVKRIDEDIILKVEKMGFDRVSLVQSLMWEEQTKATVAYYLLLDSQEKKGPNEFLEGEFNDLEVANAITSSSERSQNQINSAYVASGRKQSEGINIPRANTNPQHYHGPESSNSNHMSESVEQSRGVGTPRSVPMSPMSPFEFSPVLESTHMKAMLQKHGPMPVPIIRVMPQGNWVLGFTIDCPPHLIMGEVLKALQHLEVSWKIVGAYYAKCKWVPPSPKAVSRYESVAEGKRCQSSALTRSSNATLQSPIKFEAQLFKVPEGVLLDFHCMEGPSFVFLDLCASFLAAIWTF
jgi:5'-AMP-activated protein kinase catalytic alpha subunit